MVSQNIEFEKFFSDEWLHVHLSGCLFLGEIYRNTSYKFYNILPQR